MRNVPKLRFKEFSGEWEEKKLIDIVEIVKRRLEEKKEIPILTISAGKGFISQEERFSKILAGNSLDKYTFLKKDEFSYNRGNSKQFKYGCIYKLEKYSEGLVPNVYRSFKLLKGNTDFYFQLFLKKYLDSQLMKLISSSARMDGLLNIGEKEFFNVKIPVTSLQEQEKIADFLSSVDKKISITEEKLDLFKEYKKGIMQKIFNQELRFKDSNGNDYPEWEEKRLEEIADCLDNKRKPLNSTERDKIKGNIPYYGANGIQGYINDFIFDEELVLLAEDGGNFDDYLNKPIAQYIYGKSWINNHAHILKGKKETFTKFLFYSLEHKDIRSFINGTSRSKLNKSDMLNISISYPCLEEQQKIANFLSSIDKKIDNLAAELKNLKEFKKGLLQQMFV